MSYLTAAYLEKLGAPLVVASDIEIPELREGQVLVKIAFSGVCHSQVMEARGWRGEDRFLPHKLGHEASGVVLATGPSVSKVREGDRVVLGWIKGHGREAGGSKYRRGSIEINAGGVTTFQSHAVVSENRLVPLDPQIPMDVAVLFGCAIPTGAGIVLNSIDPKPDTSVLIWGLGGIGLSAMLATRLVPFKNIIVVDVEDSKLALARTLGATHTINAQSGSPVETIMSITDKKGVDYAIEAAGYSATIEQAFASVRKSGGLCVFASHPKHGDRIQIDPFDLICGKRIQGTWGGECQPDRDVPRFAELYKSGQWPLELFFSKRYQLQDINQALNDLESRKLTRALIEIDSQIL